MDQRDTRWSIYYVHPLSDERLYCVLLVIRKRVVLLESAFIFVRFLAYRKQHILLHSSILHCVNIPIHENQGCFRSVAKSTPDHQSSSTILVALKSSRRKARVTSIVCGAIGAVHAELFFVRENGSFPPPDALAELGAGSEEPGKKMSRS